MDSENQRDDLEFNIRKAYSEWLAQQAEPATGVKITIQYAGSALPWVIINTIAKARKLLTKRFVVKRLELSERDWQVLLSCEHLPAPTRRAILVLQGKNNAPTRSSEVFKQGHVYQQKISANQFFTSRMIPYKFIDHSSQQPVKKIPYDQRLLQLAVGEFQES